MKRVEYERTGGPEVLRLAEVERPACGPGEVRVAMQAVSVNPVDAKIRSGLFPGVPPHFPSGTGRDGAGVVTEIGEGVDPSLKGARVCYLAPRGATSWAEEVVLPAEMVEPFHDALSMTEAASLPLAAISAWVALMQTAEVGPGMTVLIHAAAGGVGSLAVQIAAARGATVIGTCSARNADFVTGLGAERVVAYDAEDFTNTLSELDLVLDLMGGDVHERSYSVLRPGGTLVYLAALPFDDSAKPEDVTVLSAQVHPGTGALRAVLDLVAGGKVRPVVTEVLDFSEFEKAQSRIATGHVRGKIVLTLGPGDG